MRIKSPPSRGAWIEMTRLVSRAAINTSPPSRGAWIEIFAAFAAYGGVVSPPSRGAWIEIGYQYEDLMLTVVAPLAGGVD